MPENWSSHDLTLITGEKVSAIAIGPGLTLLHISRESSATVLALTLAGRMAPRAGQVIFECDDIRLDTCRDLFKNIALAGVDELDTLERLVSVHSVVREQLAWSAPWYKRTPRNLDTVEAYTSAAALVGFALDDAAARTTAVGDLGVLDRLRLRVVLALVARPDAKALIVDDIDKLRSVRLRAEFLRDLSRLSERMPVVAISANTDIDGIADTCIDLQKEDAR